MKITPLSGGQSVPQVQETNNNERLARAKAIAEGKILVKEQPKAPEEPQEKEVPSIKMVTNVSPDAPNLRQDAPGSITEPEVPATPSEEAKSATPDPSVEANAAPEDTKPISPQSADLAKYRRAVQVKDREIADLKKSLEEAKASVPSKESFVASLKANPLSVLQEAGVSYDDLTQAILSNQNGVTPELLALREEVKQLKAGFDKTLSDKDAQAEKAVLTEIQREVNKLSAEGEEFELIRVTQSQQHVVDLIHRMFKENGELLSEREAMELIENELLQDSLKRASLKKIKSKLAEEPAAQKPQSQQPQGMKTLTNRDSASSPMSRRERAIAAMNGTLKR